MKAKQAPSKWGLSNNPILGLRSEEYDRFDPALAPCWQSLSRPLLSPSTFAFDQYQLWCCLSQELNVSNPCTKSESALARVMRSNTSWFSTNNWKSIISQQNQWQYPSVVPHQIDVPILVCVVLLILCSYSLCQLLCLVNNAQYTSHCFKYTFFPRTVPEWNILLGGGRYSQILAITGMCCWKGYGFQAIWSGVGFRNHRKLV